MKTNTQHATSGQTDRTIPFTGQVCTLRRALAVFVLLFALATAGTAVAKSMYVIGSIINFDAPIPVHVYDIGSDGLVTYQTEFGAPFIGAGMRGIAMDSDTGYLFSTYEDSGFVLVTNAVTLTKRTVLSIPHATNLAGIVYDHQRKLLYIAECGRDLLYVLSWDSLTGALTPVLGSPFTLEGAMIYGIALDEYSDLLYVASPSQGIAVYSTSDWRLVRTELAEQIAISIAIDPERDYLYYGGGFADNFYLTQRRISDWSKKEVLVDPTAGIIGLGVDPDTGLIYATTGRDNREGCGKDLVVYDTDLNLLQTIPDIGRPTGLVIPFNDTSFNPLNLTKTITNGLGGKPNSDGLYYTAIGDLVKYSICFDDSGYVLTNVLAKDRLPAAITFVSATGDGDYGQYDADTHIYTWRNPPMKAGSTTCLELVGRLKSDTTAGQVFTNQVTLDTDQTAPVTVRVSAIATQNTYHTLSLSKVVLSPKSTTGGAVLYVHPGDEITYRINYDNSGNDRDVSKVVIVDTLPQYVDLVRATGDGEYGSYDRDTNTYTWMFASLAAGEAGSVDITVRLRDDVPAGTVLTNRATIRSDETPDTNNGTDVTVAYAALDVEKTVVSPTGRVDERDRPYVDAGGQVTYNIAVRNPTRNTTVTQITVVDELPREMTFIRADGEGDFGFYDSVAHTFTWEYPLLASGAEAHLTLVAAVSDAVEPGTVIANTVTVSSKQAEPSQAQAEVVVAPTQSTTVQGEIYLKPNHIWRNQSEPKPDLMVVVHLPKGYGMDTIVNAPLVLTPGNVASTSLKIFGTSEQGKILCFFDTDPILAATEGYGEFAVRVTGQLTGGRSLVCDGKLYIVKFGGP
jgi:fimbrial isopeptide formation D2 family protein/uncharacterized repeat protein (TIGR01451 family)